MSIPSAEWWAAIAALFSALAAVISLWQQKRSHSVSLRPHLLLCDLKTQDRGNRVEFTIGKIKNVGSGVALEVRPMPWITPGKDKDFPKDGLTNNPINIIESKGEVITDWKGHASWELESAQIMEDAKMMHLKLEVYYHDAEWNQYSQDYYLSLNFGNVVQVGSQPIGKGILLNAGRVRIKSRSMVALETRLRSMWFRIAAKIKQKHNK